MVCRSLGVATQANSVPYLATYLDSAPVGTIERTAELLDRLDRRIEDVVVEVDDDAFDRQPAKDGAAPRRTATGDRRGPASFSPRRCGWGRG